MTPVAGPLYKSWGMAAAVDPTRILNGTLVTLMSKQTPSMLRRGLDPQRYVFCP